MGHIRKESGFGLICAVCDRALLLELRHILIMLRIIGQRIDPAGILAVPAKLIHIRRIDPARQTDRCLLIDRFLQFPDHRNGG